MAKLRPCLAEGVGTFALIFIGIGAIKAAGNDLLAVAFANGFAIAAFASATMNISGGHLNPAVTFGALVGGKIRFGDAVLYWISQLLGATLAAYACGALLGMERLPKARRNWLPA
jgi:glycerol uptake facilitator-like aquaporin